MELRDKIAGSILLAVLSWSGSSASALTVDQLDTREWHVERLTIHGNAAISTWDIRSEILTKPNPWYTPWRKPVVFDPQTFETDLERLRRLYESRGFFEARIVYDLEAEKLGDGDLVSIELWIEENQPVRITSVNVETKSPRELALPPELPIRSGDDFSESAYQRTDTQLKEFFMNEGYAHVQVQRDAQVDLSAHRADVSYTIDPGPECTFGPTRIEGNNYVTNNMILREREWHEGDRFSIDRLRETRDDLLKVDLFRAVDISFDTENKSSVVTTTIKVEEKLPREIRVAAGYGTDDHYRVQARWQNNNWLGDGRQLGFTLKYSSITSLANALFVQPHFLVPRMRGVVEFEQTRDSEDNYLLYASRLHPRLEPRITRNLSASFGMRAEADKFSDVAQATKQALGGVKDGTTLFGFSVGLVWNTTTEPLEPRHGEVASLVFDDAGLGGDFRFYKIVAEAKKYQPLPWQTVLASRAKLAFATPIGAEENLPLSERLYEGGEGSVRGYGRRRLGPRDSANNPIGGESAVEGSLELRHAIWGPVGGAVFLDAGQVSLNPWDPPIGDLNYGSGFALTYATPVGPLRFDIGFPFERPPGDAGWVLYFSIGQFY
jgi:outer membrane protein assembly complex protein YaeT